MKSDKIVVHLIKKYLVIAISAAVVAIVSIYVNNIIKLEKPHLCVFEKFTNFELDDYEYGLWLIDFINNGNAIAKNVSYKLSFKETIIGSNQKSFKELNKHNKNTSFPMGNLHRDWTNSFYYLFKRADEKESEPSIDFCSENANKFELYDDTRLQSLIKSKSTHNIVIAVVVMIMLLVYWIGYYLRNKSLEEGLCPFSKFKGW